MIDSYVLCVYDIGFISDVSTTCNSLTMAISSDKQLIVCHLFVTKYIYILVFSCVYAVWTIATVSIEEAAKAGKF